MLGPNCGYEEVGWRGSGKERHTLNYQVGTQRQWAQVAQRDTQWSKLEHENTHNNKWAQNDTKVATQCH